MNATGLTTIAIARVAHEANRAVQYELHERVAVPWDSVSVDHRNSVIDGVRFITMSETEVTPEESHEHWRERKTAEGWIHGTRKDERAKTHPDMVPWDELPANQQLKDKLFVALVRALA